MKNNNNAQNEVSRVVNTGKNCTGCWNTGNWNTGSRNTGDRDTGNRNTGNWNTGDMNTGHSNVGSCNIGCCNTGDRNTGDWNAGDWNAGDWNTGGWNVGSRNTGDWNKSSYNTGCFNTKEHKIFLFNKDSDWTYQDWLNSDARSILMRCPSNYLIWMCDESMTHAQKEQHPEYLVTRGFLNHVEKEGEQQIWWNSLPLSAKNIVKSIPNFDAEIFFQCTGIRID